MNEKRVYDRQASEMFSAFDEDHHLKQRNQKLA